MPRRKKPKSGGARGPGGGGRGRGRGPGGGGGRGGVGGAEESSSGAAGANAEQTDPMDDLFFDFFESFKEENEKMKFYKAELASMDIRKAEVLRIDYLHVMKYNPALAFALIAEPDRTKASIVNAFRRFIPADSYLHGKEITVKCCNFPVFERKEMLLDFLVNYPPVVAFRLHDNVETPVCSPEGSEVFQGYIDYMVTKHRSGLTWDGDFQASDMVVLMVNGRYEFHILKQPSPGLNHDNMSKDFKKLADILLHQYTLTTGGQHNDPPFFTNLCKALRNIPADVPGNAQSMEKFVMFICNHMAFLPSLSRSNLICNLMRVYKALSPSDQVTFASCVDAFVVTQQGKDWRSKIQHDQVFQDVCSNRPMKKKKKKNAGYNYNASGLDLLKFQRNFIVHAVEYLKDASGNPTIITLEEIDYFLAYHFDKYLVEMLKRLIDRFDMKGLLQQVWEDCTLACSKNHKAT